MKSYVEKMIKSRYLSISLFVLFALAFPLFFASSHYAMNVMIIIFLHGIVALGLCLMIGFTGQISIAQAAFYGIGGYTSAILSTSYGLSPWLALLIGCVLCAIIAIAIGIPTIKLEENYLVLATLGFGIIVYIFFVELKQLTGGHSGLTGIPKLSIGGFSFDSELKYYYLVVIVALLLLLFASSLVRARVGRALRAIRGSQLAAESLGINSTVFKVKVFVMSAVYASIAGSLYVHYVSFISPSPFYVTASINFAIMAVVGGMTNIWGGFLGAAIFTLLGEVMREVVPMFIPRAGGEYELIFFGVILIATMIFMPQGLAVAIRNRWIKWTSSMIPQTEKEERGSYI